MSPTLLPVTSRREYDVPATRYNSRSKSKKTDFLVPWNRNTRSALSRFWVLRSRHWVPKRSVWARQVAEMQACGGGLQRGELASHRAFGPGSGWQGAGFQLTLRRPTSWYCEGVGELKVIMGSLVCWLDSG